MISWLSLDPSPLSAELLFSTISLTTVHSQIALETGMIIIIFFFFFFSRHQKKKKQRKKDTKIDHQMRIIIFKNGHTQYLLKASLSQRNDSGTFLTPSFSIFSLFFYFSFLFSLFFSLLLFFQTDLHKEL